MQIPLMREVEPGVLGANAFGLHLCGSTSSADAQTGDHKARHPDTWNSIPAPRRGLAGPSRG